MLFRKKCGIDLGSDTIKMRRQLRKIMLSINQKGVDREEPWQKCQGFLFDDSD